MIEFFLDNLNYWTVFLGMMIESSFIPFPSEVIVPPAAWLALGPDSEMNIVLVVLVATLGADAGALINYYLAKWLGRPIVYKFANSRVGHLCLLNGEKVAHAEEYFRKHGVVSTFFGRLVPAVRQLISIPAGLSKMSLGRFTLFTGLGAGIWVIILTLIGVYFGHLAGDMTYVDMVHKGKELIADNYIWILIGLVVFTAAYLWVHKRIMKRKNA